jgi:glyoxylase-like metal-dependent hydrolase (beta-lactamase superfamily II)
MGPGHAPGDSIMVVPKLGVVFSGDVIFNGRLPFLDSPDVNTANWLEGLDYLTGLDMEVRTVIPGHGNAYGDLEEAAAFTRDYISFLRERMGEAVADFVPFEQAYAQTDWSRFEGLPAFDATNRGNAYRIYLEMEREQLGG